MQSFLAALAAILITALAAQAVLEQYQVTAAERFATAGVRLGTEN